MRMTERRLRRAIKNIITESSGMIANKYGVKVSIQLMSLDDFSLEITLDKADNVSYAKNAVEMQEGSVVSENGNTIVAKFPTALKNNKSQGPYLVADNIAFWVSRCA
jgi:hypothetical protein